MIAATVSGRIGREAETRPAGNTTVTSFSVASSGYRNKEKTTDWVSVSMWGARGERIAQHLTKGAYVTARGEMWVREYQGKDGTTKTSLELRADDIDIGGAARAQEQRTGGRTSATQSQRSMTAAPDDDFGGGDDGAF